MQKTSRIISLSRAGELREYNRSYEEAKKNIPKGWEEDCIARYQNQKTLLMAHFGATEEDWASWTWQMENRVDSAETLGGVLHLSPQEISNIQEVAGLYRWAITPYYLALIDPENPADPIRRMSVPSELELDTAGKPDPMGEEYTNPAGAITRRYPDRLILNTTNSCAMFCRHCQRRRRIGEYDMATNSKLMDESIDYIRRCPEIRDVLITGGDPFTLSDEALEDIVSRVRAIPHVETIRIGTRVPVTMPQRVTPEFVAMLRKYHPLYVNTQFNHPRELTPEAVEACVRMADAGIPLGNQMVLLRGVNDDKYIVRCLNHEMLKSRVSPYYIFHAKQVIGTAHFRTSVDEGLEIMDHLRGYTSGMAIPTYIINAPDGLGKIPILPNYIIDKNDEELTLRTWEGKLVKYPNKSPSYSSV